MNRPRIWSRVCLDWTRRRGCPSTKSLGATKPPLETADLVPPSHKSSTPGIRAISNTGISFHFHCRPLLSLFLSNSTSAKIWVQQYYVLIWIFFVASHPSMAFRLIECFYGLAPGAEVLSHPWFTVQNLRTRQLSGQVARRVLRLADTAIAIIYIWKISHTPREWKIVVSLW